MPGPSSFPLRLARTVRTGRGQDEEGTDASPSSARSPAHHQLLPQDGKHGPSSPPPPTPPPRPPPCSLPPASPGRHPLLGLQPESVCLFKDVCRPPDVFTPSGLLLSQFNTRLEEETGLPGAAAPCTGRGDSAATSQPLAALAALGVRVGGGGGEPSSWSPGHPCAKAWCFSSSPAPPTHFRASPPGPGQPGSQTPSSATLPARQQMAWD